MRWSAALVVLWSVPGWAGAGNLLAGKAPIQLQGITNSERITDGVAAPDGDEWKSSRTSIIPAGGFIVWDLGELKPVKAAQLQGDNNDDYLLEGSADAATWAPLWSVHTVAQPGLQMRTSRTLDTQARYVRLTARGGDGSFSVSEVELHSSPDTLVDLKRQRGRSNDTLPGGLWLVTLAMVAYLVHSKQKILWVLGSPLVAALLWASLTALLDRFVGA